MYRVATAGGFLVLALQSAHAQTLFFDDFEAGGANWTMTSLWHVESSTQNCGSHFAPFPSGTQCVWWGFSHGVFCDYDAGGSTIEGTLRTVLPISLPATARKAWLRYKLGWAAESCIDNPVYDASFIGVVVGSQTFWLDRECGGWGWHKGRADLTPYLGQDVSLVYGINTVDGTNNHYFGWLIDDVQVRIEPGQPFCDASSACPCGNANANVPPVAEDASNLNIGGCKHSFGLEAELFGEGEPSVAADTVALKATELPNGSTALFFQGTAQLSPTVVGDGNTCVGGQLLRLGVKAVSGGIARYPGFADPALSVHAVAGQAREYQVYYRNAAAYCTPGTFNLTNAYEIDWAP